MAAGAGKVGKGRVGYERVATSKLRVRQPQVGKAILPRHQCVPVQTIIHIKRKLCVAQQISIRSERAWWDAWQRITQVTKPLWPMSTIIPGAAVSPGPIFSIGRSRLHHRYLQVDSFTLSSMPTCRHSPECMNGARRDGCLEASALTRATAFC